VKSGTEEAEMTSVGLLYLGEVLLVNAEEELASLVTHDSKFGVGQPRTPEEIW
jgi:hypothetical protein